MKTHFWKISSILLLLLLLAACKEHVVSPGQYKIVSVKIASETDYEQVKPIFNSMPVFTFKEGEVVDIKPDFSFGYFKDSLFTYKLKDGYLYLKGKNTEHKIKFDSKNKWLLYELYLETKYFTQISIVKEIQEK